jgi:hypothetical protein
MFAFDRTVKYGEAEEGQRLLKVGEEASWKASTLTIKKEMERES